MSDQTAVLEMQPENAVQPEVAQALLDPPVSFSLDVILAGGVTFRPQGTLPPGVTAGYETLILPTGNFLVTFDLVDPQIVYATPAVLLYPRLGPGLAEGNEVIGFGIAPDTKAGTAVTVNFVNSLPKGNVSQGYGFSFVTQQAGTATATTTGGVTFHDPTIVNDPNPNGV